MEKLQSMVTDFVERVNAFSEGVAKVKVANSILIALRGLLAVIMSGQGVESIAGLDAKSLETAIAEQDAIVQSVSPEERQALNEACTAIDALVKAGVLDDDAETKVAAQKAVDDFRKNSVTVVPPAGKARTRAA